MKRRVAAVALGTVGLLALSPVAQAGESGVDITSWINKNKETIELFLDIDVETCKGLDGLTYEESVRLADANGIDLKELATKQNPAELLEYADNAGITLEDLDSFLTAFCAGEVTPPPPSSSAPGTSTDSPSATGSASEAPSGVKTDKPSPSVSAEELNGKMADTGSSSPWVPLGFGVGALALGTGGYIWARRSGKI